MRRFLKIEGRSRGEWEYMSADAIKSFKVIKPDHKEHIKPKGMTLVRLWNDKGPGLDFWIEDKSFEAFMKDAVYG